MEKNEIPHRAYLDKLTPAEKAIYDAIQEVEKVGTHPELTNVVILLGEAKDKLSDYMDRGITANDDPLPPDPSHPHPPGQ